MCQINLTKLISPCISGLGYLCILVLDFFFILNMQHKRLNHILGFSDFKPNSIKIFSLDVPCMAPVMVSAALYWTNSSFSQKDSLESWS